MMATAHTPRVDNARGFLFDPTHVSAPTRPHSPQQAQRQSAVQTRADQRRSHGGLHDGGLAAPAPAAAAVALGQTDFSIPLRVSVGLVGFDGDGGGSVRLPSESLQRALSEALPVHVPAVVEAEAAGRVQFHLEYRAAHLERAQLTQLEDALKKAMRLIGTTAEGVSSSEAMEQCDSKAGIRLASHLFVTGSHRAPFSL